MIKERLMLTKHYITIECDSRFRLVSDSGDVISKIAGTWIIDVWKLLPAKYQEKPQFFLTLEIDNDSAVYTVTLSDIDLDSVAGVNGQLVEDVISHEKLDQIKNSLGFKKIVFDNFSDLISSEYCMYASKANLGTFFFSPFVLGVNFVTSDCNIMLNFKDKLYSDSQGFCYYGFNGISLNKDLSGIMVEFMHRYLNDSKGLNYGKVNYLINPKRIIKIELFL